MVGITPSRSGPTSGAPRRRATASTSSTAASARRACATTSSPAGVISTARRSRSNTCTASVRSSVAICVDSAGWVTPQAAAARRKLRWVATATTYSSWRTVGRESTLID
jgi:hypothetical protein